jgi:hypothetical protein
MAFTRAVARSRTDADVLHTTLFRSGPLIQSGKSAAAAPDIASSKDTKVAIFGPRLVSLASRVKKGLVKRGIQLIIDLPFILGRMRSTTIYSIVMRICGSASVEDCHCGFMEHARSSRTSSRTPSTTPSRVEDKFSWGCIPSLSPTRDLCSGLRLSAGRWIKTGSFVK